MDRWKEYFEELLHLKCKTHTGDDEEDNQERKEEMRNEVIMTEKVIEAIHIVRSRIPNNVSFRFI